jgi:hypothetical protein
LASRDNGRNAVTHGNTHCFTDSYNDGNPDGYADCDTYGRDLRPRDV